MSSLAVFTALVVFSRVAPSEATKRQTTNAGDFGTTFVTPDKTENKTQPEAKGHSAQSFPDYYQDTDSLTSDAISELSSPLLENVTDDSKTMDGLTKPGDGGESIKAECKAGEPSIFHCPDATSFNRLGTQVRSTHRDLHALEYWFNL